MDTYGNMENPIRILDALLDPRGSFQWEPLMKEEVVKQ